MKRKISNLIWELWWVILFVVYAAILLPLASYLDATGHREALFEYVTANRVNEVVATILTMVIFSAPFGIINYLITNWYILKLNKTLKITDMHERINAQENLLKEYVIDQSDNSIPSGFVRSKMVILHTLALNYIGVTSDYKTALNYLERAVSLSARLKAHKSSEAIAMGIEAKCRLWEAVALNAVGEHSSAERKIEPFMSGINKLTQEDRATVWIAQTELATGRGDFAVAREYHIKLDEDLRALAVKYKRPDLIYDAVFLDGILCKREGNKDAARQKLEDVLKNTTSEMNRVRARRELEDL